MAIFFLAMLAGAASPGTCTRPHVASAREVARINGSAPRPGVRFVTGLDRPEGGNPAIRVYVKQSGHWLSYDALEEDQQIHSVKRTRDGRRMVWAQHTAEGPVDSFEVVLFDPRGPLICSSVSFSAVTNWDEISKERSFSDETLDFDDVNIDARGRGALVASGDIDVAGHNRHVVYKFTTSDGGKSWSAPLKIARTYHPSGVFAK